MKTKISFHTKAPWQASWGQDSLLIYDRILLKNPQSAAWIKKFPRGYAVKAGESLKDLKTFPQHFEKIHRLIGELPNRNLTIWVAGGGSVGDFGGMVAMLFKRGVRLVHVPTTWLAAIDSSHGGKNGLNVLGAKNQIGGFYPASQVLIVKPFLLAQGEERAKDAAGELLKMALLRGGASWKMGWKSRSSLADELWRSLPLAIRGKNSIVARDPLEKSGIRHLLNLGHTMGHAFEVDLGLSHGMAVGYGLVFALAFSLAEDVCSVKDYEKMILHPLWGVFLPSPIYDQCLNIPTARLRSLLNRDKKRTKGPSLRFIFLKSPGQPVIREISVEKILSEVQRQKALLRSLRG